MRENVLSKVKKIFFNRYLLSGVLIIVITLSSFFVYVGNRNSHKVQASEGNFRWDSAKGEEIEVCFSQHPYTEAIIHSLPDFEKKTGIKVNYTIIPEEFYYEKLSMNINRFRSPDAFMIGPYFVWNYASKGYIQDLNYLLKHPDITDPSYDINDFYPNVLNSLKWDTYPGHMTGTGNLWGIPLGFEVYPLAYNKRIFQERGLKPPKTMEELLELCKDLKEFNGKGTYALAVRGAINWATINTSYITTFANYGAKDFDVENGKLVSTVNSKEAVAMTDMWIKLIKAGGTPTDWGNYTWDKASADFGAGKAAMLFDADILGYYQNYDGETEESNNIAWIKAPLPEGKNITKSNLWTWGLAISSSSRHKDAAWLFVQYFTSKEYTLLAAEDYKVVDPARKSVLESNRFQKLISDNEGYSDVINETINNAAVQFTPEPYFFKISTEWSQTLQDIYFGKYKTAKQGMDALKIKIDNIVKDIVIK